MIGCSIGWQVFLWHAPAQRCAYYHDFPAWATVRSAGWITQLNNNNNSNHHHHHHHHNNNNNNNNNAPVRFQRLRRRGVGAGVGRGDVALSCLVELVCSKCGDSVAVPEILPKGR